MKPITRNIIDLHCDTLCECMRRGLELKNAALHISLDKLPPQYRWCQMTAIFMPDELRGAAAVGYFDEAYAFFLSQMEQYGDEIGQVRDTTKIRDALTEKQFAAILTVEGGSALGGDLANLQKLYDCGVRMMGLTWNAANEICGGAATDLGFTEFGWSVVAEMERVGMAVDVSHLSDRGFWELCSFATKPFVASHSNARAICNHRRNLTDEMFRELVKRGGLVGLNYSRNFIREGGGNGTVADLLRHVHHFIGLGGAGILALGSDYDGTDVPDYLGGFEKIEFLAETLLKSGITEDMVNNILFNNANSYFAQLSEGVAS